MTIWFISKYGSLINKYQGMCGMYVMIFTCSVMTRCGMVIMRCCLEPFYVLGNTS